MKTTDTKAERDARLAAALRANLRRRKAPGPVADASPPTDDPVERDQRPIA